jgi:predicted RNase H-like HicB family nuclease
MQELAELKRQYAYMVRFNEEGGHWEIFFPDLPGLSTWVESVDEIGQEADDILTMWLRELIEEGSPIPPASRNPFTWNWTGSTKDVAKELGVSPRRVRQIASSRGIGMKSGRDHVFTRRDIDAMRERRRGRPPRRKHVVETT